MANLIPWPSDRCYRSRDIRCEATPEYRIYAKEPYHWVADVCIEHAMDHFFTMFYMENYKDESVIAI